MRPRLMRPDNFTPPTRTPWGGRFIVERLKRGLQLGAGAHHHCVGESWEVSVEPSFPSRFLDDGLLGDAIAIDPAAWLGVDAKRHASQTPLLVKLLDAAANLSVQVHPTTDDPALRSDESGKPEAWYVLAAEPGAGLYLGFADGVQRPHVAQCLQAGGPLDELMNFVAVAPGDAFLLGAGTVHAIGAGVTLLEPQFVTPGRRGVTYRYWDWNRRYDDRGQVSPTGRSRPLHVERSLAVTAWNGPRGADAIAACRALPTTLRDGPLTRTRILSWPYFELERWAGSGSLALPAQDTLLAITCVAGAADLHSDAGSIRIHRGLSAVVPAAAGAVVIENRPHPLDGPGDVELLVTRTR